MDLFGEVLGWQLETGKCGGCVSRGIPSEVPY